MQGALLREGKPILCSRALSCLAALFWQGSAPGALHKTWYPSGARLNSCG